MLHVTPQERLALGVTALLIAAGAGVRMVRSDPPPVEWTQPADTSTDGGLSRLRAEVARENEDRRTAEEPLRPGERIDPNAAEAPELDRLPRVGPSLARRIVDHRLANGPFRTTGDLDVVPGVGPAVLEAIAPHVALAPGPPSGTSSSGAEVRGRVAPATGGGLDLNSATAAQLEALPGIGPALAERIVAWRAEHGPFESVEALEAVPGVGPSLRTRISPLVRIRP